MGFLVVILGFLLGVQTESKIRTCKEIEFKSDYCSVEKKLTELKKLNNEFEKK